VFDQPEPGRKIEPFKSLASSPGSIFFETLEADVIAIQIADRPEPIVGVGNHRDFEVIGLMPRARLQISDHHSFLSKTRERRRVQSQKSSSQAQEVSRHFEHL